MDKVLKWSIAHQSGDKEAIEKVGTPDPRMLSQLFGGPDEPTLMKQSIVVVTNPDADLESKEVAFDNFEMLIENLDNANNIENIKLWPAIISQLDDEVPVSLRIYAASVIGIAVQNNPKSQEAFLKHEEGLRELIRISVAESTPTSLLMKTLFAISSFIRNFEDGYKKFDKFGGWAILKLSSSEVDHKVNLRILSVISAVLSTGIDKNKEKEFHNIKLVKYLVSILQHDAHVGCVDKVFNIISQLKNEGFAFSAVEIAQLSQGIENIEGLKSNLSLDDYEEAKRAIN